MRTIEVIEFRDTTGNSEDGFSARFQFRLKPPGSAHRFTVKLSGSEGASSLLNRGRQTEQRDKAMDVMRAAAREKTLQNPRHELPEEEEIVLKKRDVEPFASGKA